MNKPQNWIAVSESQYPWERDALEFVRNQFPIHEPYRAWANFEFIADDGSINEVDLLVCTPQGFFLIEIKSRPGRLFGDAGTWTWETDSRLITTDSPVLTANRKAKKLRSLLQQQKACKKKGQLPFLDALVFCSAPDLRCELQGTAEERRTIERAAQREAQLLETLQHQAILRREGFTEHVLGPALILEHDPLAIRLDHFLAQRKDKLGVDLRLDLLRQIAEVIRFAHDKKVVHRALSPYSILVTDPDGNRPRIKVLAHV